MHRFGRYAHLLYQELYADMVIYAENVGEMTLEEWLSGQWFVDGRDDGRETWCEEG